jgi:hypothetical protein
VGRRSAYIRRSRWDVVRVAVGTLLGFLIGFLLGFLVAGLTDGSQEGEQAAPSAPTTVIVEKTVEKTIPEATAEPYSHSHGLSPIIERNLGVLPLLIHPSAWKVNSTKLNFRFTEFYEVHSTYRR